MTYEEMRKTMQFILEQQAQLTANQQRADERINRADKLITRTARTVDRLATNTVERFERTDARISAESEDVNAKLAALVDSQMRTEEVVRRLSERGEKTDEAVRNLTDVFDRHLREYENGDRRQRRDEPAS
jgi:CHASE3 domain sensor protein